MLKMWTGSSQQKVSCPIMPTTVYNWHLCGLAASNLIYQCGQSWWNNHGVKYSQEREWHFSFLALLATFQNGIWEISHSWIIQFKSINKSCTNLLNNECKAAWTKAWEVSCGTFYTKKHLKTILTVKYYVYRVSSWVFLLIKLSPCCTIRLSAEKLPRNP